ncbi:MAG TPA: subclass B3 metallo-beta-lactamase [Rubricoccaceae bacterium]|jgi:metallo-beta-lactamase class B
MKLLLPFLLALGACSPVARTDAPSPRTQASALASAAVAPTPCDNCAAWNVPHAPVHLYGTTYYVGTAGLSAILVTSPQGHVLIDGALQESAPLIAANVEALGFRMEDVKLILNSHAHYDHAAGIAALQHASGATVAATAASAAVLRSGRSGPDDPQAAELLPMTPVPDVRVVSDGETVRVGPLALTAHATPGHTAGGTTWSWTACEGGRCLTMVYADSISPVSEEGFRFSQSDRYPTILADFERSFATLDALPCDILMTPHPEGSRLFERIAARDAGVADALVDPAGCSRYAAAGRERLARRLETEG